MERADLAQDLERRVAEVEASRARIVHAEAQARSGLERDLHDGVQQQLVAVLVRLTTLRTMLDRDSDAARVAEEAHAQARESLTELRALVQGLHPPSLTDHGLVSALRSRVAAMPFPVSLDIDEHAEGARFSADLEGAAYYAACEALTNAVKHSGATDVRVTLEALDHGGLRLVVSDDGCGFAGAERRSSVPSLRDRVEAAGGALEVRSGEGQGTRITATFVSPVTSDA
jgi:signal transduction histidine kinase